MTTAFTPLFIYLLIAIFGLAAVIVLLSAVLGPRRETLTKRMPYESGMDPVGDARQRFDVRYYLVAIAFLLFDVELLFLYPWAVSQFSADVAPFVGIAPLWRGLVFAEILVFIATLAAAFVYAWRKEVFTWR